jgi:PAS domain S-box-containing protein
MTQIAMEAPTARLAISVEAAPAAVLVASPEGRVLAANKLACGMLGWRRIELLSLGMLDVGLTPSAMSRVCEEADERGLTFGATLLRHRNGGAIPIRYQASRIEIAEGPVYLWVAYPRRSAKRPARRDPGRRRSARALRLTARELEIVQLIADGLGNRDIALQLSISLETVKTHVRRLLGKLGARGRAHAVAIAWRKDLVD